MTLYSLLRPILFRLPPELSHDLIMNILAGISRTPILTRALHNFNLKDIHCEPIDCMGIPFPNRLGLAAGLDKSARAINALSAMGFGWIEVGTVTPMPQPGNPKPRMFRISEADAIINRMGFNSIGLEQFITHLNRQDANIIKGINIGKNAATPIKDAVSDYLKGMDAVYPYSDYICVNISSPNTQNLRQLHDQEPLIELLGALTEQRKKLSDAHEKYVPLVLKIAPDIDSDQIETIARLLLRYNVDGIAATNTTIDRPMVDHLDISYENGGLSGRPLREKSTQIIAELYKHLQGEVPIIGIGGIYDAQSAQEKLDAGATLLQIYSGFIYQGPALIREILRHINQRHLAN